MVSSRTYSVTVSVVWSFDVAHGEETHLFRLRDRANEKQGASEPPGIRTRNQGIKSPLLYR